MRVLLLMSLLLGACSTEAPSTQPNVLFVCMDTVRADHLGCYGYDENPTTPQLDELARASTLFRDASATAGWTKPSVPSFLTGTYPMQHGVYEGSARGIDGHASDVLPERAVTLAEVFHDAGYDTAAFVENAQLKRGNGFEQGFDIYRDKAGDAREIRWRARDWLDDRTGEQPFFLYLHFLDAHWPYPAPEEYAGPFVKDGEISLFQGVKSRDLRDQINHGERVLSEAEMANLLALYDGSIRYIDDQLGKFFETLEHAGEWENTIVCVISDHGEEFMEHGRIGHGHGLYENLLAVPWILRVPGRDATEVESAVSLVDVFPTLLGAVGIDDTGTHSGMDRSVATGGRPILAEHKERKAYVQALRAGSNKVVRRARMIETQDASRIAGALTRGSRWEIEFELSGDGAPRARKVQPKPADEDQDAAEIELKGKAVALAHSGFALNGTSVRVVEATEFYGAFEGKPDPASLLTSINGVKVKGVFDGDVLVARKIKGYFPDEDVDCEIRGPLAATEVVDGVGTIRIGPFAARVDESTDWSLPEPNLSRETIASYLESGQEDSRFSATEALYDLERDPQELSPAESAGWIEAVRRSLGSLSASLVARRIWSANDRVVLGDDTLDELRAIGYAK